MQFFVPSGQEPVTWWKDRPVHLTTLLIVIQIAALLVTTLLLAISQQALVGKLIFSSNDVLRGEFWRLPGYWFVIPPTLMILISLFFFGWFGLIVEQFLGWRRYLKFYLVMCLVPCAGYLLLSSWVDGTLDGPYVANSAVFIAFATIYPDAQMIFGIKAKWWAWASIAITVLQCLAYHALWGVPYLVTAGAAYLYLKALGVQGGFEWLNRWQEEREDARQERIQRKRVVESKEHFISEQVDPILDKIARKGMQSLTEEEKRILERARDKLR